MKLSNQRLYLKFFIILLVLFQNHHCQNTKVNNELFFLSNLNSDSKITEESRASSFALKWAKYNKLNIIPKSIVKMKHNNQWRSYVVALSDNNGKSIKKRVCFSGNANENYGLVVDSTKNCLKKVVDA